jgi:hypothetical protein
MKSFRSLIATALFAVATSSEAAIIAYDSFSYSGELNGQNGGTGWVGAWSATTAATQIVDPVVNLIDNSALQINGNNDNVAVRSLANNFSGNQIFVDFYLQVDNGNLVNNDFLAFWFGTSTSPNFGIKADQGGVLSTNDVFGRLSGGGGPYVPNSNIGSTNDITHHIVALLSKDVGSSTFNRLNVWLNPVFGDLATPDLTDTRLANNGLTSFNRIGFRSANLDRSTSASDTSINDVILIDNLRLSTTWNEAMNIPEPATLALLGIGFAGIGLRYRK